MLCRVNAPNRDFIPVSRPDRTTPQIHVVEQPPDFPPGEVDEE
jgi:hypothetical protein